MKYKPHSYQQHAFEHVISLSGSGLFMEMGLGKTVVTLSAADYFLNDTCEISKVLVIAPKKVAESVWKQEGQKWDHLNHLRFSLILGDERKRKKALRAKADIYVINRENVPWLVALSQGKWKFDMVVIDESTSFKNHESKRFRAIKAVLPAVKRTVILTGTPMPNSILDLWSQVYLIDQGKRLGENFFRFRDKYFEKKPYQDFVYTLRNQDVIDPEFYQKEISEKISDICISLKARDYLKLPGRIDNVITVSLTEEEKKKYQRFEKDQVLKISEDQDITPLNAAALTNKLLQFANGAVYDEYKNYHVVHDQKLDYLEEIIESANGEPVLVAYSYRHDLFRILKRLKKFDPVTLENDNQLQAWNRKEIKVLLVHPASAGHGLNLQAGGRRIVLFGLTWNLEWLLQLIGRLDRQGQTESVIVNYLLTESTMDEEVYWVLQSKAGRQEMLMDLVKAKIKSYYNQKIRA